MLGGGGDARDHQLCEEAVHMAAGFEAFKGTDFGIQIAHFLDHSLILANHVDTMSLKHSTQLLQHTEKQEVLGNGGGVLNLHRVSDACPLFIDISEGVVGSICKGF